jgi:Putative abortive phage resistance protein AbiGi, antitoxin
MAGRYPNTLFHFTNSRKALFGILAENFQLSYARERIEAGIEIREFAAPMVSFCDLRLSETDEHIASYGRYGIGLTKQWAIAQGLSPVAYWTKEGRLLKNMFDYMSHYFADLKSEVDPKKEAMKSKHYHNALDIYRFIKNYDGLLKRNGAKKARPYRFANEREWRYVPPLDEPAVQPFLPISMLQEKGKSHWNATIAHIRLLFEPKDIRYIIVSNESERMAVVDHLKKATHKVMKYGPKEVDRLASRVLTTQQIRDDV